MENILKVKNKESHIFQVIFLKRRNVSIIIEIKI